MQLTVLAAAGATGRELTRQALERGHTVTAIARTPGKITAADSPRLIRVAADVRDVDAIGAALASSHVVLSGLGASQGKPPVAPSGLGVSTEPGVLTAGARAVVGAQPRRVIWLGAVGTGASAQAAGWLTRTLLGMFMRGELTDKVTADSIVLRAGGTVFHAGPMSDGPLSPARRTVGLDQLPRRIFPARVSRATVAAAMLDEAEAPKYAGAIAVPLSR